MYIIINKTRLSFKKHIGDFPRLNRWLDKGDRLIVISLYSNTIKVPYSVEHNGVKEWEWDNFPVTKDVLDQYKSL